MCPARTTTRRPRTRTSATSRASRTPTSSPTTAQGPAFPPAHLGPPTPPTQLCLRGKGRMTWRGSSLKKPSRTWMRTTTTLTTTPLSPRRRSGRACQQTRTPSSKGLMDHGARKVKRENLPSLNQACSWRGHRAQKAPRVCQDLQERWVPLAKWVTLEKGVPLDAQVFPGLTGCLAPLEPCSCCLSGLEGVAMPAPKAPWSQPRSPKLKPFCSRPGWR